MVCCRNSAKKIVEGNIGSIGRIRQIFETLFILQKFTKKKHPGTERRGPSLLNPLA